MRNYLRCDKCFEEWNTTIYMKRGYIKFGNQLVGMSWFCTEPLPKSGGYPHYTIDSDFSWWNTMDEFQKSSKIYYYRYDERKDDLRHRDIVNGQFKCIGVLRRLYMRTKNSFRAVGYFCIENKECDNKAGPITFDKSFIDELNQKNRIELVNLGIVEKSFYYPQPADYTHFRKYLPMMELTKKVSPGRS